MEAFFCYGLGGAFCLYKSKFCFNISKFLVNTFEGLYCQYGVSKFQTKFAVRYTIT